MGIGKRLVRWTSEENAKIAMTKLHHLLPKYNKPERGLKMGGYAVRGGGVMFRMQVELEERTESLPLKNFGPF